MRTEWTFAVALLLGIACRVSAGETPTLSGAPRGAGGRAPEMRQDADPAPPGASAEMEAGPVAGQTVDGLPVAPPDLQPANGAPLLGDEDAQGEEEAFDRRFGLLARPWRIRHPIRTRYDLEAKARADTGLPPYLQDVERADRVSADFYDALQTPVPHPEPPRPPDPVDAPDPDPPSEATPPGKPGSVP